MIDIKFLRENPEAVRISQRGRGEDPAIVDQILAADEVRRIAIVEFEGLRAEQNIFSNVSCLKCILSMMRFVMKLLLRR